MGVAVGATREFHSAMLTADKPETNGSARLGNIYLVKLCFGLAQSTISRDVYKPEIFARLPCAGEALAVVIHVAQGGVDHGEAFGVMAGGEFVAHAHAAMQLYRLL